MVIKNVLGVLEKKQDISEKVQMILEEVPGASGDLQWHLSRVQRT